MNAFELLKSDHEKVSEIFERLEATEDSDLSRRQSLFEHLKNELEIHSHLEETIFYPALKQASETRELILESIDVHQEVKLLLIELDGMAVDIDEWGGRIADLKAAIEHHVEEEESELFDKAQDVLTQAEIDELSQRMAVEKQKQMAVTR